MKYMQIITASFWPLLQMVYRYLIGMVNMSRCPRNKYKYWTPIHRDNFYRGYPQEGMMIHRSNIAGLLNMPVVAAKQRRLKSRLL